MAMSQLTKPDNIAAVHFGKAWIYLCLALLVHVIDETANDFLSVYNPFVKSIRAFIPFLPVPTFSFPVWLGGLLAAVVLLLSLSPFAFHEARWVKPLAYFLGIVMIINGLLHFAGSWYLNRLMPGFISSPLLIACSIYLLVTLRKVYNKAKNIHVQIDI